MDGLRAQLYGSSALPSGDSLLSILSEEDITRNADYTLPALAKINVLSDSFYATVISIMNKKMSGTEPLELPPVFQQTLTELESMIATIDTFSKSRIPIGEVKAKAKAWNQELYRALKSKFY
ncbi:MAG: hypothetical protein ABIQ95_15365 [Bdellovibrionia bacterium]